MSRDKTKETENISVNFDERDMLCFIKDLLNLSNGSKWDRRTFFSTLEIRFSGNRYKVQKLIFEWLSIPERKHKFELLGGEQ